MTHWTPERIKALRKRAGLTQEDMAHELSITFATQNRHENGHCVPSRLACKMLDMFAEKLEQVKGQEGRR